MYQNERIFELQNDEEFVEKINEAKDSVEIQKLFAEQGLDVSIEAIENAFVADGNWLTESELEGVAGGSAIGVAISVISLMLKNKQKSTQHQGSSGVYHSGGGRKI